MIEIENDENENGGNEIRKGLCAPPKNWIQSKYRQP